MTEVYLPLYEAKMLSFYDSRFQTYEGADSQNLPALDAAAHDDPNRESLPRYWIDQEHVTQALEGRWDREWILGWRDIARATDYRTMIPAAAPAFGFGHAFPLVVADDSTQSQTLVALCSSFAFDFVSRQKISGTHATFGIVEQFACPTPSQLMSPCPWQALLTLSEQFAPASRELTVTSWSMVPFARDSGDDGAPFRWIPERREQIRAELDAMMFHVYGLDRDEVDYVMDTFTVLRKYDERDYGEFRTKRLILEFYDLLAASIASGVPYQTPINPPPGFGPRHDESTRPSWMKES